MQWEVKLPKSTVSLFTSSVQSISTFAWSSASKSSGTYAPLPFPSTASIFKCHSLTALGGYKERNYTVTNCTTKPYTTSIVTFEHIIGLSTEIPGSSPFSSTKTFQKVFIVKYCVLLTQTQSSWKRDYTQSYIWIWCELRGEKKVKRMPLVEINGSATGDLPSLL